MPTKHKHFDAIVAWANGAEIEYRFCSTDKWEPIFTPSFLEDAEYRIKPEEKKPVVRWLWARRYIQPTAIFRAYDDLLTEEEAFVKYGANIIKLEWSRTEFPE